LENDGLVIAHIPQSFGGFGALDVIFVSLPDVKQIVGEGARVTSVTPPAPAVGFQASQFNDAGGDTEIDLLGIGA
jgi:hypothetical protein